MPSLTFLGAAETVTGSKHLLDTGQSRVLVDRGLFQGLKPLRERNWQPLPVPASSIHAVVLTHAHLDHSGYLPRLAAAGFTGPVWCTHGTRELCSLVLPDSARIQEEDARDANRQGYSKHHPALPLYSSQDAERALSQMRAVEYGRPTAVAPGVDVEFINAGHLLGSAYARVTTGGRTILFGGDLGRYGRPVLPDPQSVDRADVLLVESTYGNRAHEADDGGERLATIVNAAAARGGKLIIPAFAIGRVGEGPDARGRRAEGSDQGSRHPRGGAHRNPRFDVGARRRKRDHAVVVSLLRATVGDLSRARRTGGS